MFTSVYYLLRRRLSAVRPVGVWAIPVPLSLAPRAPDGTA